MTISPSSSSFNPSKAGYELLMLVVDGAGIEQFQSIKGRYLCFASLKPREFYGGLLEAVGVEPVYTVSRARKLWQEVVRSRSAPGERTIVAVIDEAHEMSEAMLLELRFALLCRNLRYAEWGPTLRVKRAPALADARHN